MSTVWAGRLDLREPLRRVRELGVAVVPAVVAESLLTPLLAEVDTLPYHPSAANALPVTTKSELAVLRSWSGRYPTLGRLGAELTECVHRDGAVPEWQPNEIFVRRYHPGSTGMSAHHDGVRFRYLIATFTVLGSATFRWCDDADRILATWAVTPGDLVLLRGTGLADVPDGRPRHSVGGPTTARRCSVAFRMSSSSLR